VVEKSGIPVAAVISVDDLERFTKLEQQRAEKFKILDTIGEAFKDVPPEQLLSEVNNAVDQVRKENKLK